MFETANQKQPSQNFGLASQHLVILIINRPYMAVLVELIRV